MEESLPDGRQGDFMPKNSLADDNGGFDQIKHLNKTVLLLSLVSLFLAAGLLLSLLYLYKLSFVKKPVTYRPQPAKIANQKPKPGNKFTILSLNPSLLPLKLGQNGSINLSIQTGTNLVSGVEFTLNFDPTKIEILSIVPAGFFAKPNVLASKIDNQKGTLYYAIGTFTPKSGNDNLVTFIIKGKALGQHKINFGPDAKVAAKGEGSENVLKETIGVNVEVK
ncbi:hypothetical protein HY030_00025 [Candidatus Gottesmanbacteria bacterium]|nr:hypothetical protein [Candidatus Gottesmanbacteria bacterium]